MTEQEIWIRFMCATLSDGYLTTHAADKADMAMEEYKRRWSVEKEPIKRYDTEGREIDEWGDWVY